MALFLVTVLCGCASNTGNARIRSQSKRSMSRIITLNVTTKAEVREALGNPDSVSFSKENLEIWTYSFSRVTVNADTFIPLYNLMSASTTVKSRVIMIVFNLDGVVVNYDLKTKKEISSWGLLH